MKPFSPEDNKLEADKLDTYIERIVVHDMRCTSSLI